MKDSTRGDSSVARPFTVLLAPTETFRKIAERPTWLVALVIIIAAGLIATWAAVDKIDFDSLVREQLAESGQTEEQIDQAAGLMSRFGKVFAYGGTLVGPWLAFPVIAAAFFVALRILGASTLGFGGSLAVATHAFMPQAVKSLLTVPIAMGRTTITNEEIQGGGIVPSNLQAFLGSPDQSQALTTLYQSVDFFSIWTAVLLAIGYQHVAGTSEGRLSPGKAWGAVIGLWLLWIALRIGWAAFTQSFA